jgi:hypothetical protein
MLLLQFYIVFLCNLTNNNLSSNGNSLFCVSCILNKLFTVTCYCCYMNVQFIFQNQFASQLAHSLRMVLLSLLQTNECVGVHYAIIHHPSVVFSLPCWQY